MLWSIVILVLILLGPRLMVLLSARYRFFGLLGPVFLCYALGFLMSLILPERGLAATLSEILVPIAIPLILFSSDFRSMKRMAGPTMRSFVLICLSVIITAAGAFFLFRNLIPDVHKYAGMVIGLYTGGTPNLMAIGMALKVPDSSIVLANTVDLVVGGVYFLLLISLMPRITRRLLPAFCDSSAVTADGLEDHLTKTFAPEKEAFSVKSILRRLPALGAAVLSLGIAAGIALLLTGELAVAPIMLIVTTCGILGSLIKPIRECPGTFSMGQYMIYMFSLAIGLSFDFSLINVKMLPLMGMFALCQFGAVFLHLLFAKLAKIDGDTALITSTAGIYGPAFIVPVADALKNPKVVLPGLLSGILGYAIGNYLGIGIAFLLSLL